MQNHGNGERTLVWMGCVLKHDDIMIWKCFPHHWPFGKEVCWSPMDSPHKGSEIRGFDVLCCWPQKAVEKIWVASALRPHFLHAHGTGLCLDTQIACAKIMLHMGLTNEMKCYYVAPSHWMSPYPEWSLVCVWGNTRICLSKAKHNKTLCIFMGLFWVWARPMRVGITM